MQTQIDVVATYARQEHYTVHPQKSYCVTYRVTSPSPPYLNGTAIPCTEKLTHLGIDRYSDSITPSQVVPGRISLASRTAYALMGSGFHGMNGISPKVSTHIYQIYMYVMSRLMYGLEAVILKPGQIAELASYHKRTLREIQYLPPRTAGCAIFLLAGVPPLEAILDSQLASLLYNVHKSPSDKLRQIGLHQLSCKDSKSSSWFVYCAKRLAVYDLDSLDILLGKIKPSRAKHTILSYWTRLLQEDALTKSTLKYLDASKCSLRSPHPVWSNITCSTTETRKAIQKAKMLCGVYTLQTNRAVFNQYQVDSTCPMCLSAPEDRIHLLVITAQLRKKSDVNIYLTLSILFLKRSTPI